MITKLPKVSIVLPVYNVERFLDEALLSMINQTFKDFELIAIDDGSKDNSFEILKKYKNEIPNFTILKNKKNMGMSFTLNKAINLAKGQYIMRMDGDDLIYKNKIEKQVSFLDANKEIDVVGCGYNKISENGKIIFKRSVPEVHRDIVKLINLRKFFLSGPNFEITDGTLMARSNWFQKWKYDETIFYAQDFNLICRSLSTTKFANLPNILYSYRIGSGVTANFRAQIIACKVKWKSIKTIPKQFLGSSFIRFILLMSLIFRPLLYLLIVLYQKIKSI